MHTVARTDDLTIHRRAVAEILVQIKPDIVESSTWEAEALAYLDRPPADRAPVVMRGELSAATLGADDLATDERELVHLADQVIAVSSFAADDLASAYAITTPHVVPNGVDRALFGPGPHFTPKSGYRVTLDAAGLPTGPAAIPALLANGHCLPPWTPDRHGRSRLIWIGKITPMKGWDLLERVARRLRSLATVTVLLGHSRAYTPVTLDSATEVTVLHAGLLPLHRLAALHLPLGRLRTRHRRSPGLRHTSPSPRTARHSPRTTRRRRRIRLPQPGPSRHDPDHLLAADRPHTSILRLEQQRRHHPQHLPQPHRGEKPIMRILLIGPTGEQGSIPPYLRILTDTLRYLGTHVDRVGAPSPPYDQATQTFWPTERILQAADALLRDVDLTSYDVISLHFGNLEIDQLLPAAWAQRRHPPVIYHVHSLDWSLFTTQRPDPALRAAVDNSMHRMDGFVFFGTYGHNELTRRFNLRAPSVTAWLPTTIPAGTRSATAHALRAAFAGGDGPVGSLYGYAAPWKDPAGLVHACQHTKVANRIVLAGPLWDDPQQAGIDLGAETMAGVMHGAVRLAVINEYLDPPSRRTMILGSDYAIFPYQPHPTFQGSGAIADYLAHGLPVLGTDVANMAELIGDAGLTVPPGNAEALDRIAGDTAYRRLLTMNAQKQSRRFSAAHHAARCLRLYRTVAAQRTAAA